jgi:hypothetical protein
MVWAALSGCNGARFVAKDQFGGVVAIPANTDEWPTHYRAKAEELMRKQCPEGYVIDHEEEAVIGQTTTNRQQTDTSSVGSVIVGNKVQQTESHDLREWRITFHRKGPVTPGITAVVPAGYNQGGLPREPVPVGQ